MGIWWRTSLPKTGHSFQGCPTPNERPTIALIGSGGQGSRDTRDALRFGDVIAVADVDKCHLDQAVKGFTKDGKVPAGFSDFRKLLERDDIVCIINGTPDHWHSLVNIAAARAKKISIPRNL